MRKWRCIKSNNKECFTVGKIYTTDDYGYDLVGDNGDDDWCRPSIMHETAEFEETFEEIKLNEEIKPFTQSDLKPCMFVKLRGYEEWCIIIQAKDGLHINSLKDMRCMASINNYVNFRHVYKGKDFRQFDILEVKDVNYKFINGCVFDSKTLWKLEEKSPQQIKLEELELKQREIADEMAKLRKEMD